MKNIWSVLLFAFLLTTITSATAQPTLEKDYSFVMEIPSVIAMESSPAHLYTLSDTEGMAVFRARKDSLQWLYSSTGMEQRGHKVTADIRFAYLFGDSRRLTVLEPTSVLGVYSSTLLPSNPLDAKRIGQNLYIALGDKGLGKLSLRTPSSVDSTVQFVERSKLSDQRIVDLESAENQLFALAADNMLYRFSREEGTMVLDQELKLSEQLNHIFLVRSTLYGSDNEGNIYEIDGSGNLSALGSIGETATQIEAWKDWLIIRGSSNRLWTSYQNRTPELWKKNKEAGNFFTVNKGSLWLSEYNQISKVIVSDQSQTARTGENTRTTFSGSLSLKEIPNQTVPHSKPVLLPIQFEENVPANAVKITYQSPDIDNAEVRGFSFYWQPTSDDVGTHRVKLIATSSGGQTDSTTFNIDVQSFNAPPRFAPIRPISIAVGEEFTLPIEATDPDGQDKELVRFLGVDLPEGASINESTGLFKWTPTERQIGENQFRIIATDQYGAAKSTDITINVVENVRGGNTGN